MKPRILYTLLGCSQLLKQADTSKLAMCFVWGSASGAGILTVRWASIRTCNLVLKMPGVGCEIRGMKMTMIMLGMWKKTMT